MYQLKKKTILLVLLLVILAEVLFSFVEKASETKLKEAIYLQKAESIFREIDDQIEDKQQTTLMLNIGISSYIAQMMKSSSEPDKQMFDNLLVNLDQLLQQLTRHTQYKNIWFQMTDPNGKSLYRSWSEVREDLSKVRVEFSNLKSTPKLSVSVSSGRFDVSMKAIVPILVEGELRGFLEAITHFNSIQKHFENHQIDSLVVATVDRSRLINKPFSPWQLHDHYVANLKPNRSLLEKIGESDLKNWFSGESKFYPWQNQLVVAYPIIGTNGQTHGYFLAFIENSDIQMLPRISALISEHHYAATIQYLCAGVVLLLLILYQFRHQKKFYKSVLDSESEIVIITDGKEMKEINARFFDYFGQFQTLKEFKNRYKCICDLFVKEDSYLQKDMGGQNWLVYLLNKAGHQSKVKIVCFDKEGIEQIKTFHVKANLINDSKLSVVVLTDITENEQLNEKLYELSLMDELTMTANRRAFNAELHAKVSLTERQLQPLNLIVFDIDHFKQVNDTYGHDQGDVVLKTLTKRIKESLRESDQLYRIGGEEFAIILLSQTFYEAKQTAEKIREIIAEEPFATVGQVTASFGVAYYRPGMKMEGLYKTADTALYQAKKSGRNKVVVAQ